MAPFFLANGKFVLVGGRPLKLQPGEAIAPSGTLTLSVVNYYAENPIAEPAFQRKAGTEGDSNGGNADVPVLFSYTGTAPAGVQARVVSAENGSVIKDWATLTSAQVSDTDGTGIGTLLAVPIGCKYLTEIRILGQTGVTLKNGTRKWGVGPTFLLVGQSNMISTLTAGSYNERIPGMTKGESDFWGDGAHAGVYFSNNGFTTPYTAPGANLNGGLGGNIDSGAGGASAFVRMVSAALTAKYGRKIPVCAAIWVWNGTGLGEMFPPGAKSQVYTNTGITSNNIGWKSPKGYTPGDFEGILMHQGEADSANSRASRVEQLKSFYQYMLGLVAPYGRTANNLFFRPAVLGSYTSGVNAAENMRGATYDLEAYAQANGWPRVKAGWTCIDLDPADGGDQGLHFRDQNGGNQYQKWSNRRMAQTTEFELGTASFTGMGPKISGATRSGNVATINIAHDGGTTLAGRSNAALSGWYANTSANFTGTAISVTAAIAGPNTIAVTFPDGTAFPCYLKYMGGVPGTAVSNHPDLTNPVYDNTTYPTGATGTDVFSGLPLQPTPDAITVN